MSSVEPHAVLQTFQALDSLAVFATSLPSLPAVSGILHRVAGMAGLSGTPGDNWMIIGAGVLLHWGSGKIAWAWGVLADLLAMIAEIREWMRLNEGRRMGGESFTKFAEGRAVAEGVGLAGRGPGVRVAYVMVGGTAPRVLIVNRPARARKVAGKGIRRAG